jgi:peptidyl-dipeptidase Dcp
MDSVKPYLQVPNIQKAMFWMAKELYGFKFTPLQNIPVYHPEVTVFKVTKNNKDVGLWYFDPYARQGKRSGAWMNAYRLQHRLNGQDILPIVSNNSNFVKAAPGETTLISWDDAQTMFHEFGHALHGLSSNVTYPSLAGTQTARDFVEFPSQIHEDWLSTPEVLKFLVNKKGEPFPQKLIKKLKRASTFNEGFATTEYLASALVDMKLHLLKNPDVDPRKFEKETLKALGMPKANRHAPPHASIRSYLFW